MMWVSLVLINQYIEVQPKLRILLFVDFTKSMAWNKNNYAPFRNFLQFYSEITEKIPPGAYMSTYIISTSDQSPVLLSEVQPYPKVKIRGRRVMYGKCRNFIRIGDNSITLIGEVRDRTLRESRGYVICWHTTNFADKTFTFDKFINRFRRGSDYGSPISRAFKKACDIVQDKRYPENIIIFYSDMIEEDSGNRVVNVNILRSRLDRILSSCSLDNNKIKVYIIEDIPIAQDRKRYKNKYQEFWRNWLRQRNIDVYIVSSTRMKNILTNKLRELFNTIMEAR